MKIKTYDVIDLSAGIEEIESGDFVKWEDVVNWLIKRRNGGPMTGKEAAAGFLCSINKGFLYTPNKEKKS